MPFTLSHAAAIVPLNRKPLSLAALIIGSFAPDFVLYFAIPGISRPFTHSTVGAFAFGIPFGWILFLGLIALGDALSHMLPEPHRSLLAPVARRKNRWSFRWLSSVTVSLAIGALTHVFWDHWTHRSGWFVHQFDFLSVDIFGRALYNWLQHFSTVIGFVIIVVVYEKWLKRQALTIFIRFQPTWRLWFWLGLCAASMGWAALWLDTIYEGIDPAEVFELVFVSFIIRSVQAFLVGLLVSAVAMKAYALLKAISFRTRNPEL